MKEEIRPSHPSVGHIRSVSGEPGTFHLSFLPLIVCGGSDTGTEGHHLAKSFPSFSYQLRVKLALK